MKNVIITGANSDVGAAVAEALAQIGGKLGLVVSNDSEGHELKQMIEKRTGSGKISIFVADLSKQREITQVANAIASEFQVIDVLINCGGLKPTRFMVTEDGFEKTWATNHLSYFLLTHLLLRFIRRSANGMIINTTSMAARFGKIHWDDVNFKTVKFSPFEAYCQSKLANMMFTVQLAELLHTENIPVIGVYPGAVSSGFSKETKSLRERVLYKIVKWLGKRTDEAARSYVWLVNSPDTQKLSGKFIADKTVRQYDKSEFDQSSLDRLWKLNLTQTNLT